MERHRLLMKGIAVLALAIVANVTGSGHLAAEAQRGTAFACAACFLEADRCEDHEDEACWIACGSFAWGQCSDYDPEEVACQTELQVYDWVECF